MAEVAPAPVAPAQEELPSIPLVQREWQQPAEPVAIVLDQTPADR